MAQAEHKEAFVSDVGVFRDEGCYLHPSCLECPRAVCIYEVEGGRGKEQRDALMENNFFLRIFRAHIREKWSLTRCSDFYGVSVWDVRKSVQMGRDYNRARSKRDRQVAKSIGLCVTCKANDHKPGISECVKCAEKKAMAEKGRVRILGVCSRCGKRKWLTSTGLLVAHKGCPGGHQPPVEASNG